MAKAKVLVREQGSVVRVTLGEHSLNMERSLVEKYGIKGALRKEWLWLIESYLPDTGKSLDECPSAQMVLAMYHAA